jgi:hypothetical protein
VLAKPTSGLSDRIQKLGTNFSYFADELDDPTESVSDIWSAQPANKAVHVLVKRRAAGEWSLLFLHMRSADDIVSHLPADAHFVLPPSRPQRV